MNLSKNDITQTGIEKFAPILHLTGIQELDLSLNPLGNNGIRTLAENFSVITKVKDKNMNHRMECKICNILKLNLSETKF